MIGKKLHHEPHAEETKKKISELKKGKFPNRNYSGVYVIDSNENIYKSISEASRSLNINKNNLYSALKGRIENKYGVEYLL